MLAILMTEVMFGRAHFAIVLGLRRADVGVLSIAPRFFAMTLGGHADLTIMTAARIFDRRRGVVSIHGLLSSALTQAGSFKHGTAAEVRKAVKEAAVCIGGLEAILKAISSRRNQTMAHLDPKAKRS
jgi:hypothetical protein